MKRALAALLLATAVSAYGQAVVDPELTETVSVNYVMIPFTVLGSKGIPVTDLRARDISLLVDGAPVASDLFEASMNAPVSFTILLDSSGSMALAGKLDAARAAVRTLIGSRKAGDEFSLYVFDDEAAHERVPFTTDVEAIIKAINDVKPYGKTAFFDAIATMPAKGELGKNPTRAIILLSDGIDNASRLTRLQLAARLEGVSIPIYALGLRNPSERKAKADGTRVSESMSDLDVLDEISSETGGKLFLGNKPEHFVSAVAAMDRTLRAQYLIGFAPTGKGVVKYRRITLKLPGRVGSIRARAGYKGTEPPLQTSSRPAKQSKRNERTGS